MKTELKRMHVSKKKGNLRGRRDSRPLVIIIFWNKIIMFAIKVKSQSLYLVGNYFFRDLNPVCLNYLFGKLLALFHMNLKYMYIFYLA